MSIPAIPIPANPALVDVVLLEIQTQLIANLSWLDCAFGKAQMLFDKEKRAYPGVYTEDREYKNVFPKDTIGNFSWFDIGDPYEIDWTSRERQQVTVDYGLIFWMNLENVLNDPAEFRNLELVKSEILTVLSNLILTSDGSGLNVTEITERSKQIYTGYTIEESEQQFLMHPYAGLRFNGELRFKQKCC